MLKPVWRRHAKLFCEHDNRNRDVGNHFAIQVPRTASSPYSKTIIMQPVIVGVADIVNRRKETRTDGKDEPAELILQAIVGAAQDASSASTSTELSNKLLNDVDSISVVRPWSWPYPDLPGLLAERLKVSPKYKFTSPHGGNQPAKLLDEACKRIASGENKVAVITGGEALDSLERYIKSQRVPPPGWSPVEDFAAFAADALKPPDGDSLEGLHGLGAPIQIYAVYENALRAYLKQNYAANHDESAQMYAEFSKVSSNHPHSWHTGHADSKETIATVTPKNRMICTPYPMLMCAFNKVNIAGACIVTSAEHAIQLGIDQSKFIYVQAGAGTAESDEFYLRTGYDHSPAISQSIDAALKGANMSKDDIDLYDFYSCFPVVPKLACQHLGLPTTNGTKPITLLGGLTSFGGAGNNYSMHAISEMTRQLRNNTTSRNGLILANGGILSYQHVVILSKNARQSAYPPLPLLPEHCDQLPNSQFDPTAEGDAIVEAYTVDYSRKGKPRRGHVIGRLLSNNHRFIANHADEHTLLQLANTSSDNGEVIGRRGRVFANVEEKNQNLFSFTTEQKL